MDNIVTKQLKELREAYILSLPEKINDIDNLVTQCFERDRATVIETLHRHLHSLAGSGAIYGQHQLSNAAKSVELYIASLLEKNTLGDADIRVVKLRIEELRHIPIEDSLEHTYVPSEQTNTIDKNNCQLSILVAEDDLDSRIQLALILRADGHHVIEACDGAEAIQLFRENRPDLVLMDIVMPNIDGYTAAMAIKEDSNQTFTPIIFLTAADDDSALAKCIEFGGDRFLTKPYNRILLRAEITALQRISTLYAELENYKKQTEEEIELAQHIFNTMFSRNTQQQDDINCWTISAGHFNGDVQLYKQEKDGTFHLFLGDFTGHGLGAALGSLVAGDLFHSLLEQKMDQNTILYELNKKLITVLPIDRFCSAGMASYFPETNELKVWNSGLPAPVLVSSTGEVKHEFNSLDVPLGVLPRSPEDYQVNSHLTHSGDILLLYSDGITDASNAHNEHYGEKRLHNAIHNASSGATAFNHILRSVQGFIGNTPILDDMSLISVSLNGKTRTTQKPNSS